MDAPTYKEHYEEKVLPGFSEFRYLTRGENPIATMQDFKYKPDSRPLFNSFARRLRVAKSMQSVNFDDFSEGTANGYAALNKHFLMFSALERYTTDCEGVKGGEYHRSLRYIPESDFKTIKEAFDLVDTSGAIFDLLSANGSISQKVCLREFKSGESYRKGIYISSMLRNLYAHGVLSAFPRGAKEGSIELLANFMTDFIYNSIRKDFWFRLNEVKIELDTK